MEKLNLEIDGMSCGHCVAAVKSALTALDGVRVERVEIGSATLAYDPARVPAQAILDAVEDEGYSARPVAA
jgi:copper chaperone CopZ